MQSHLPKFNRDRCLTLISMIEIETGKMFHETHSDLESSFWLAVDSKQSSKLLFYVNQLSKILDDLKGGL